MVNQEDFNDQPLFLKVLHEEKSLCFFWGIFPSHNIKNIPLSVLNDMMDSIFQVYKRLNSDKPDDEKSMIEVFIFARAVAHQKYAFFPLSHKDGRVMEIKQWANDLMSSITSEYEIAKSLELSIQKYDSFYEKFKKDAEKLLGYTN